MVGRPSLPIGTFGKVTFVPQPSGSVEARVKFRDYDGRVRLVSKTAASRAAAERALKAELTVRSASGGTGSLTAGTRVSTLAHTWLAAEHGWSTGTERTY